MKRDLFPNHQRLNPKVESTFNNRKPIKKKPIANDEEKEYLNWLHEDAQMLKYKCFVCGEPVEEYHHVKLNSSDKKNHKRVLPLCKFHHTDGEPSPHKTAKKFRGLYPMEYQNKAADLLYLHYQLRNNKAK